MKIVFIHPDLGIGGAERLVLDMGKNITLLLVVNQKQTLINKYLLITLFSLTGLTLKNMGHSVHFVTSHHNSEHCFKETKDGTLNVTVIGDHLPRNLFNRFHALCAYFRMIYIAICLFVKKDLIYLTDCDLFIVDQISISIYFLRWFIRRRNKMTKILFYCHFPDQLLTERKTIIKKMYRFPIDWLEEKTTGLADCIVVNSNFTATVFRQTFQRLKNHDLQVIYPICNFTLLDSPVKGSLKDLKLDKNVTTVFLSLNRFERKKNHELAVQAFAYTKELLQDKPKLLNSIHLIIAGGYDERLQENVEYFKQLADLAESMGMKSDISLISSPSDQEKQLLLHSCTAVLYTPQNEHFGIVPLEAMYMGRPVIACNSGGPLETVIDNETGYHCEPNYKSFAQKMLSFVYDKSLSREMGINGRNHVKQTFSSLRFKKHLQHIIEQLC